MDKNLEVKDGVVVMPPAYRDEATGAVYVNKDYELRVLPFDAAEHISPPRESLQFKDVASWAAYVKRYGDAGDALLTYSDREINATLDYHNAGSVEPGRCQWKAFYRYPFTSIFRAWKAVLGETRGHESMVILLDDSLPYIQPTKDADAATMVDVISALRVTTKSSADTEIRGDGSTAVKWSRDIEVRGSKDGEARIPAEIKLRLPIVDGREIDFTVRLRVQVSDKGKVAFGLSSWDFEGAVDGALAEEVKAAEAALRDFGVPILHVV